MVPELALVRAVGAGDIPPRLKPPVEESALAAYRWFVGHHAAFVIWRLLSRALCRIAAEATPTAAVHEAILLYEVYSALLRYSGSLTAEVYARDIRPRMAAADPAFSGRWARDHEPIPALLRAARAAHPRNALTPLDQAVRQNALAHRAVARRLVPEGASLLSERGGDVTAPTTERERRIFDAFFRVQRVPVCRAGLSAQLVRRLAQVLCDLAHRPLGFPEPSAATEEEVTTSLARLADSLCTGLMTAEACESEPSAHDDRADGAHRCP
jgi:hypothetical protein